MQPANIIHQDGFEVILTHQSKRLTIYDSLDTTTDLFPDAARNVENAGYFAGFSNKIYVVPEQSDGDRSIAIHLRLLPLFDFFSANAVRAGLCIVDAKGEITFSKDRIIYKKHRAIVQPEEFLSADWSVPGDRDTRGKLVISLTRVHQDESDPWKYELLARQGQEVYTLIVDWHAYTAPSKTPNPGRANSKTAILDKNKRTHHTPPKKRKSRPTKKVENLSPVHRPAKTTKTLPSPKNSSSSVSFVQVLRGKTTAEEYNASRRNARGPLATALGRQRVRKTRLLPSLGSSPPSPTPLPRPIPGTKEEVPKEVAATSIPTPSPSASARDFMQQAFHRRRRRREIPQKKAGRGQSQS